MKPTGLLIWLMAVLSLLAFAEDGSVHELMEKEPGKFSINHTGVWLTPRFFPNQGDGDIVDMFERAADLGEIALVTGKWGDADVVQQISKLSRVIAHRRLKAFVVLDLLQGGDDDSEWDYPAGVDGQGIRNESVREALRRLIVEIAQLQPEYLVIGRRMNRMAVSHFAEYEAFSSVYADLREVVQEISPDTRVGVSFDWEQLYPLLQPTTRGKAVDVDDTGALLLELEDGTIKKIIYGDCFHR